MNVKTLINQAARGRAIRVHHGSIATNVAAQKLEHLGTPVLPQIESYLSRLSTESAERPVAAFDDLMGLRSVLMVYLRLAADWDPDRVADFLRSITGPVRTEALRACLARWGPASSGSNGIPPEPLARLFKDLKKAVSASERKLVTLLITSNARTKKTLSN